MTRVWVRICWIIVAAGTCGYESPRLAADEPHWIWSGAERSAGGEASFQKEFSIRGIVTSAELTCVGEFTGVEVNLNQTLLAHLEPYDPLLTQDVTDRCGSGDQRLTVRCTACDGPSAFFLQLDFTLDNNSRQTIVTDGTWVCRRPSSSTEGMAQSFGAVSERLLISGERRVGIRATDNYEQWRQALGEQPDQNRAKFLITPGFELTMVRSAQPDEDSWVSLAFDPQGRAIVAREEQGLLRMKLSSDGQKVTRVELIEDTLRECRGLLFVQGDLFVNANHSKGLYRLRKDGPDRFHEPELLHQSSGGTGHGRNDLALGPDDKIYMIHGDSVDLPEQCVDYTSPFREARQGQQTKEGHLLRIDPDGGRVELLASGLRNPFGIDFNSHGEVFTYDADAEYDMGSPWYRPTRVNHLVVGGDYGWRGVTKSWPPYYPDHPDNALPNLDIGKGSPTAVKFGTRSNFPPRYREALYILDWAYGRIIAVHLSPRGSSYLMSAETFLKGRPLNVTDLDFAPDGSMYFVTGGRGTQSAMYRIQFVGDMRDRASGSAPSPQQQAREDFARESRTLRRHLETKLLEPAGNDVVRDVWPHLSDDDPWIRHAARNVLERQPWELWQDRAFMESDVTARLAALLSLARANKSSTRIIRELNSTRLATANRSQKMAALYAYSLCLPADSQLDSPLSGATTEKLNALFPDQSFSVNRLLSELLIELDDATAFSKTIDLLKSSVHATERMHYLFVLRNRVNQLTREQRRDYFHELAHSKDYLGGAGMPDFLRRMREESLNTLTDSQRVALAPIIDPPINNSDIRPQINRTVRPFVRKWTLDLLEDSLTETDSARDLERGQRMFTAASCVQCHRFAGRGTLIGPDLTSVSSRFSRRDLLESILVPSKVIPEKYRSLQVITSSGKMHTGQIALGGDYRSTVLRLATDPLHPFKITEIEKQEIERQRFSPTSWMPEGLLDTLTRQEILDLLAYLESQGEVPR